MLPQRVRPKCRVLGEGWRPVGGRVREKGREMEDRDEEAHLCAQGWRTGWRNTRRMPPGQRLGLLALRLSLCPAWHSLHPGDAQQRALASLSEEEGAVICYTQWALPMCQALCQACSMFISHNMPILQVRKLRLREVN